MNPLFFDAFVLFGKTGDPGRFETDTPDGALAMMDHFGIRKALVRRTSQEWSVPEGNGEAAAFSAGSDRFFPVWQILPSHTGEFPGPGLLAGQMARNGVRALVCDPSKNFSIRKTFVGDIMGLCAELRIPVLLPCPDYAGYEKADALLSDFPDLTLVACNTNAWGLERYTFPLFERYGRFHLCLGPYRVSGAVQETIARFGARRLLFGTNFPFSEPGGACGFLARLDICDGDRDLISHDNIERLLREARL